MCGRSGRWCRARGRRRSPQPRLRVRDAFGSGVRRWYLQTRRDSGLAVVDGIEPIEPPDVTPPLGLEFEREGLKIGVGKRRTVELRAPTASVGRTRAGRRPAQHRGGDRSPALEDHARTWSRSWVLPRRGSYRGESARRLGVGRSTSWRRTRHARSPRRRTRRWPTRPPDRVLRRGPRRLARLLRSARPRPGRRTSSEDPHPAPGNPVGPGRRPSRREPTPLESDAGRTLRRRYGTPTL